MDSPPNPVPCSGTTTDEKARILGLQAEEQVNTTIGSPALEDVLDEQGTVSCDEVATRALTLAQRPAGHDHQH
ncbi:hypothetical protein [Streptomyces mirabilis]|uniref:hypothetical protein n=1 Tax=Streptomyces mirabilis TaxID=68239 RepID=UPI00340139C9